MLQCHINAIFNIGIEVNDAVLCQFIEVDMRLLNQILRHISVGVVLYLYAWACVAQASPQVMGWVPAYGMARSMAAIESNSKIGKGLTRLGLQLWNPSVDGLSLVFAPIDKSGKLVSSSDVIRFRDWAQKRNIKVLLTVYNNSQVMEKWDWPLARRAFAENRADFSAALVREMNKYELDGIDLDLEGEGDLEKDRVAYSLFVGKLSTQLKLQGKLLTIDSFHSPCDNAPNMRWWIDWIGKVDAIHSMGYQDLYEGNNETFTPPGRPVCEGGAPIFKYSWQLQYAMKLGYKPEQISMGMPTWLDSWGTGGIGSDLNSHLREVKTLGMGVALWDLQLTEKKWRSLGTWNAIRAMRLKPEGSQKSLH